MRKPPDIVVIVDQKREYNAVQECQRLQIPIVAMLDTNCDPDTVDVPIPGNDDAIRAVKLIMSKLADAILEGKQGQPISYDLDNTPYEPVEAEEEIDLSMLDVGAEDDDV